MLVIAVSNLDDVVKDVLSEYVNEFVTVFSHVPHVVYSYHLLQLPRGNQITKEVWKRTAVICSADVLQKFSANKKTYL